MPKHFMRARTKLIPVGGVLALTTAVSLVASCKQDEGSGLLSMEGMGGMAAVPQEFADKAWKQKKQDPADPCDYYYAFDSKSVRTDLIVCGEKAAYNKYKTVAKQTDQGLLLSSVALAQASCSKSAKEAAQTNPFFVKLEANGSLKDWTRKPMNAVEWLPVTSAEIQKVVASAPKDGSSCLKN